MPKNKKKKKAAVAASQKWNKTQAAYQKDTFPSKIASQRAKNRATLSDRVGKAPLSKKGRAAVQESERAMSRVERRMGSKDTSSVKGGPTKATRTQALAGLIQDVGTVAKKAKAGYQKFQSLAD